MKCRFEHDGDCCNCGATQYMCKCKQPCNTIVPRTNADRIRAMSDEELAKAIGLLTYNDLCLNPSADICEGCPFSSFCANCIEGYELEWLQQPAEEVDHESR